MPMNESHKQNNLSVIKGFKPWQFIISAYFWLAVLLVILQQLLTVLPMMTPLLRSDLGEELTVFPYIVTAITVAGAFGLSYFAYFIANRYSPYNLWERIKELDYLPLGLGYLVVIGLNVSVQYLFEGQEQMNQLLIEESVAQQPVAMFFLVVLVAPVVEEVIFRELVPRSLGRSWIAYIIGSILFALIHVPTGIEGWLMYGGMSAMMLYMRLRRDNLNESIAFHMLNNIVSFIAMMNLM